MLLRPTDRVEARVATYFDPLTDRLPEVMAQFSPKALAQVERFLTVWCDAMDAHLRSSPHEAG